MSYAGEWGNLTGALNTPATVTKNGSLYTLLNNIVDVTLEEPSPSNANWRCDIGAIPMTRDAEEVIQGKKIFNRATALICRGLAFGASNATYIDFEDSTGSLQGRVGQLSSGSNETYLYNNISGAGIRLVTVSGFITMEGVPRSSAAIDISDDDNIINYGTLKEEFISSAGDNTFEGNNSFTGINSFVETTLSATGGIGVNDRVRFSAFFSGAGSGYGGSLLVQTRDSTNVWVDSLIVSDDGLITSTTATGVTASSIANVGTLDARYRIGSNVTFISNGNNIILKGASAGIVATPYLRFYDSNDVALGYFGVGSSGNNDVTMACEKVDGAFNVVTGGAVSFSVSAAGYCNLGSGAPAIKTKKLTGTTAATEGGSVSIAHGLTATKIISYTVQVAYSSGATVQAENSNTDFFGYNFHVSQTATDFVIRNDITNSENILSKPITILVIFEA